VAAAAARFASTSTSTPSPPPPKTKAGQELIVLPPPRRQGPSLPEAPAISPLDVIQLAELQNVVLTYVSEVDLDTTKMEISLSKPVNPRVSKQRYEQLFNQLAAAFNVTQLRAYYDTAPPSDSKTPLVELKRAANKADVLHAIMKDRWGMEIAEEIKEREDVIVEKEIQVTRREIFFLIGEGMLAPTPQPHSLALFLRRTVRGRMKVVTVTDRSRRTNTPRMGSAMLCTYYGRCRQEPPHVVGISSQHRTDR
jgi:hypothetical protein